MTILCIPEWIYFRSIHSDWAVYESNLKSQPGYRDFFKELDQLMKWLTEFKPGDSFITFKNASELYKSNAKKGEADDGVPSITDVLVYLKYAYWISLPILLNRYIKKKPSGTTIKKGKLRIPVLLLLIASLVNFLSAGLGVILLVLQICYPQ